jgi:hypothetical protein
MWDLTLEQPREEPCLNLKDAAIADGIAKDWMNDKTIESAFVGLEHPFPSGVGQRAGAGAIDEVNWSDLSIIYHPDGD